MRLPLVFAAFATLTAAPAFAQAPTLRGHALAQKHCGDCHALERSGKSPINTAPAFRDLPTRLDLDTFADRLQEGLISGHEAMPRFAFKREDAEAFVAYLRSIEAP